MTKNSISNLRAQADAAQRLLDRGDTSQASLFCSLTIAQSLVEILDALNQIAEALTSQGKTPAPKPAKESK